MARKARLAHFRFFPADYRNDPNVLALTHEARGIYWDLCCAAWEAPEPGILPGNDHILCQLAGTTPEVWQRVKVPISRCFDTQDGHWVQKRLVREYVAQLRAIERYRRAGRASAEVRAEKRDRKRRSKDVATSLEHRSNSIGVGLGVRGESSTHSPPDVGFASVWSAYPHFQRRSSKSVSLARWRALKPRPDLPAVLAALALQAQTDDWTRENGRFVPACEVWIRERGWESSEGRTELALETDSQRLSREIQAKLEAKRAARS